MTSLVSGETTAIEVRRRVVDATYLSPTVPATTPPPFDVADDVRVVPVNELARLTAAPPSYVIVGAGKTATDGIVWLLTNGVPPDRITWVRPRDPWMLDRAVVQPDPAVALGLAADTMAAAADAESLDDLFLRLEAAGVMLRFDRAVMPTMAKTPTVGRWEIDLLRTVERVVRLGHVRYVTASEIVLDRGSVPLPPGALVVHCAASGLAYPPLVPLWSPDAIRLQTIRVGFPCFNAALAGYVEATRDDDRERNRLCPPNTLPDTPRELGADAGPRDHRGAPLRRGARHRGMGERLCAQPGAYRTVAARRSRGAGRERSRDRCTPMPGSAAWPLSPASRSPPDATPGARHLRGSAP